LIFLGQISRFRAFCDAIMIGYSDEELRSRPFIEFIHPDDREIVLDRHVRRLKGEKLHYLYSFRIVHRNGSIRWGELNAVLINWNGKSATLNFLSEITERKQAEEALRKSEKRYHSLFESIRDAILVTDSNRKIVDCNSAFSELFGYSLEELEGKKTVYVYESENEYMQLGEALKEHMGEPGFLFTVNYKKESGEVFPGETNVFYLRGEDGEVIGFIGMIRDVTERILMQAEKAKLEKQYHQAQKMESIGTLAGGIAHDFNNILSIIVGNTELAMLDVPEWSPAQDNLKGVRDTTLRARDLVKQILTFARQKEHSVSNIRLEPIAKESLKMLRASIPTMVEIREDIEEDLPSVLVDPSQIQQIIMNLCTNAGQVMEAEGGALTVRLDSAVLEAPLHTMVQELSPGRYVRMQVKDTGPGIPAENMERIFDPFFTTKGVKARAWGLPLSTALSRTAMAVLPWRAKRAGELRLRFTCPPRSWNRLN